MEAQIPCPACGKLYRWRAELAGRKAKCPCGGVVAIPAAPPAAAETASAAEDEYDLAIPAEELTRPAAAAATMAPAAAATISKTAYAGAMGSHRSPIVAALERREDEVQVSVFKEKHLPVIFIVVGVILNYALFISFGQSVGRGILGATIMLAIQVLVFVPITLGAVAIVARVMDLGLGPLMPALFKITAIALGTGALADLAFFGFMTYADFDTWSIMVGFIIYMILCGTPMGVFFEMELSDIAMVIAIMVIPRLGILFTIGLVSPHLFE